MMIVQVCRGTGRLLDQVGESDHGLDDPGSLVVV
jgi:hypothetical protein